MSTYGAWELKASYQRNLSFGLVSSLLLFSGLFLATYLLRTVWISPFDTKVHTIMVKLIPPISRPSNSSPAGPVRPPSLPVQPPRGDELMIDSLIQAPDLEWPEPRSFANEDQSETGTVGVAGNETEPSGSPNDTVINLDEFDLRPVILFKVDPKCPELARRGRITGTVTAEVLVGRCINRRHR